MILALPYSPVTLLSLPFLVLYIKPSFLTKHGLRTLQPVRLSPLTLT